MSTNTLHDRLAVNRREDDIKKAAADERDKLLSGFVRVNVVSGRTAGANQVVFVPTPSEFRIGAGLIETFGRPEKVAVFLDDRTKRLAIAEEADGPVRLAAVGKSGALRFKSKPLADRLGIAGKKREFKVVTNRPGLLIIDLLPRPAGMA